MILQARTHWLLTQAGHMVVDVSADWSNGDAGGGRKAVRVSTEETGSRNTLVCRQRYCKRLRDLQFNSPPFSLHNARTY